MLIFFCFFLRVRTLLLFSNFTVNDNLVILSFFSVVVGWMLAYFFKAASGSLGALNAETAVETFDQLTAGPLQLAAWHGAVLGITTFVVARGLRRAPLEPPVR